MITKYNKAEQVGRDLLESFFFQSGSITDWEFTTNQYDAADVYFTLNGLKVVGEIKVRSEQYKDYPTHLIEVSKYNGLRTSQKQGCQKAFYINFFGNYMYIYDLDRVGWTHRDIYCSQTTVEYTGTANKSCLLLDSKYAMRFKLENNKWKQIKN